jgi:hypothetical protein
MKTILTFALLSFLAAGCSHRDETIQRQLTGAWIHISGTVRVTDAIAPDGTYYCRIYDGPSRESDTLVGTLIAKNGVLIDTVTRDSETNQPTPRVMRWQIVRIDKNELVLSGKIFSDRETVQATFQRVGR